MIFLMFLIVISFSLYLFFKYEKRVEETLPYTFICIVLFLYIMGLIRLLKLGTYLIILLSILSYSYIIYSLIKKRNKKVTLLKLITPANIFFVSIFVVLCIYHNGRLLTGWDDFTHWGDVVKVMHSINDFSTSSKSLSAFQSYLPGMSIFQYFFETLLHNFNEGYLFISSQIFAFSLFLPFMKNITWKKVLNFIISVIITLLSFLVFYITYYKSIYIDCFLALIFAFNLGSIYLFKNNYNKENIIKLSLSLSMLVLTKDIGLFLAFICIFIIFTITLVNHIKNKQIIKKEYTPIFIFLLVIFSTYFSWKLNIRLSGATANWTNELDINFIIDSLLKRGNSYGVTVRNNYVNTFLNYSILRGFLSLNCTSTIIMFSLIFAVISNGKSSEKYSNNTLYLTSVICFYIYIFLLLILYLWKFDEYEAVNLASWQRYVGTYLQALLFLLIFIIFDKNNKNHLIMVLIIIALGINPFKISEVLKKDIGETIYKREPYILAEKQINEKLNGTKASIYFISQADSGYDYWAFKFTCRDHISYINTGMTWSIGEKYGEGDIWTKNINSTEWMNELSEKYDYVYIYNADNKFINEFGKLFESNIENNKLYKIDKINKKIVLA